VIATGQEVERVFREAGAKVFRPPFWFPVLNPLDPVPFLYIGWLCRREKYQLVVTHGFKAGLSGPAARMAGIPRVVHHMHGLSFHRFSSPSVRWLHLALNRLTGRACHRMAAPDDEQRRAAIDFHLAPPERICTVPYGIELSEFENLDREAARRANGFGHSRTLILAAGRLTLGNGFEHLIRAMPAVVRKFPSVRLAICGKGPLEGRLRSIAERLGVEARVQLPGFRHDLPELLAASDLYVQPSLWKETPLSLMEAMAAGKPIVATSIWGHRESLRHERTGLLVPPADPGALAGAICQLLLHPKFACQLGLQARRFARERFREERMVEASLELYDRVEAAGAESTMRTAGRLAQTGRA
jgi:glycosyltransferase involved in cell wall biosynthesis